MPTNWVRFHTDVVDLWVTYGGAGGGLVENQWKLERKMTRKATHRRARRAGKYRVCAVDLFCGAGGLTRGLEDAGIDVRLGIDIDQACEYPYTANNNAEFLLKSVNDVRVQDLRRAFPRHCIRLLAGCAPCQTFSTYNQKATSADERWWLIQQFFRLVDETRPHLVTMENVPRLVAQSIFKRFVRDLRLAGYHVTFGVVNALDYGVPQHRQRLVLLASKLGPIQLLQPSEFRAAKPTVRGSIFRLPALRAGGIDAADPLHQAASLSHINYARIKKSRPGGTWRDWDRTLVAKCHRKNTGKTYPSVYGRMSWDEPAPTITTQFYGFGNGRFGHPEQDRAISLREGAILQSFPRHYEFTPPGRPILKKSVGRLIGNAVPPTLGQLIGRSILDHVDSWWSERRKRATSLRKHA